MKIKNIVIFIYGLILIGLFASTITLPSTLVNVYHSNYPVSANIANLLTVLYLACYYLFQIPAGIVIDRTNINISIYLSLALFCLSFVIFTFSTSTSMLVVSRVIMAAGACFSYILAVYIAGLLFEKKFYTILIGIAEFIFALGIAIAPFIFKIVSYYFTWNVVIISLAAILLPLGIAYFFITLNDQLHISSNNIVEKMGIAHYFEMVISNRVFWFVSITAGIYYTHFIVFNEIYAPTYIQEVYHLDYMASVFLNDSGLLGYIIGCICLGIFERLLTAKKAFFIAALLSTLLYSIIVFKHSLLVDSILLRYVIYFLLGFLASFALLVFRLYQILNKRTANATTTACINIVLSLIPLILFNAYIPLLKISFSHGRMFLFACYILATMLSIRFLFKS